MIIKNTFLISKKDTNKGGYPDLNRKLTVPNTVFLPIELYTPLCWSDSNTQ